MKKRFLFFFFISGLVLMNACQKEYSLENGNNPSQGTLQDDGAGDCLPKTVAGAYVVGTALTTSNYIEVQVNVTKAGTYTIFTDTVNGMYFRVSGTFTTTGLNTVRLKGNGAPVAIGISNFLVSYGTSGCTIAVTTASSFGVFTLNGFPGSCAGAAIAGTYIVGVPLSASNNVTINVNVTTAGAYNIVTTLSNGMIFTGSGSFAIIGPQAIVLTGSGTPVSTGSSSIPVTSGASSCNFMVTVGAAAGAATFTVDCTTANVLGAYTVGTALNPATNKVTLTVNVATAGTYTITATANGMTFTASGTFASAGAGQTVTLIATAASIPTTAGSNTVNLTGGTANCSFPVTVNPSGVGAAVFTVNCATASLNGYLTKNVPVAAVNTITIDVDVATPGTYTITTTPINGITYTSSGTFGAAGVVTVTLTGSGTPVNSGTFTLSVPSGTTPCGFDVDVDPNFGTWTFKVGATTFSGTIYDAAFDNTILTPPAILFILSGDDAAGNLFDLQLGDVNGTVVSAEIYKCALPITGNIAGVYYNGVTGTTYEADPIDPTFATNTMSVTVTSHNAAAKTMTGTFSGKAILNGGATLVDITNGAFTVTYP